MPLLSAVLRLFVVRPVLTFAAMVLCASAAQAVGPTGLLNDTGQTLCDNGSNVMVACSTANTGNLSTMPRQDGRFGRDVAGPTKVGGGAAGFDFTRICWNGAAEGTMVDVGQGTCNGTLIANSSATASGPASTDWACTRDNVTNLMWSLETMNGDQSTDGSITLPNTTNGASRCGFSAGWRLPARRELLGIVDDGMTSGPIIDSAYFPDTTNDWYWSSDLYANPPDAWAVNFQDGDTTNFDKTGLVYARVVHDGP